ITLPKVSCLHSQSQRRRIRPKPTLTRDGSTMRRGARVAESGSLENFLPPLAQPLENASNSLLTLGERRFNPSPSFLRCPPFPPLISQRISQRFSRTVYC